MSDISTTTTQSLGPSKYHICFLLKEYTEYMVDVHMAKGAPIYLYIFLNQNNIWVGVCGWVTEKLVWVLEWTKN